MFKKNGLCNNIVRLRSGRCFKLNIVKITTRGVATNDDITGRDLGSFLQQIKKNLKTKRDIIASQNTKILRDSQGQWLLQEKVDRIKAVKKENLKFKLDEVLNKVFPKKDDNKDFVRDTLYKLIQQKFIEEEIIYKNIALTRRTLGLGKEDEEITVNHLTKTDLMIFEDFLITLKESKYAGKPAVISNDFLKVYDTGKDLLNDKFFYLMLTDDLFNVLKIRSLNDINAFKDIVKIYMDSLYAHQRSCMLEEHKENETLLKILSNPIHWYPETRLYKRRIILHIGPTNSGKTYNAIERLKTAKGRSFYAGPLRLLAKEIYDRFNDNFKIPCNLTTGESIIEKIDPATGRVSNISSGTTELLAKQIQSGLEYDIVVLDEIQNIGLKQRGFAWCDILLGCKAKELHLCGEPRVVDIIKKICEITKDELVIRNYTRLSTLSMETNPLKNWSELKAGDCIIESSRRKIIDLKFDIERQTKHNVAVVYGGLPLEARLQQSNMFNSGTSTVLVASNAVGVGLNLNINRIIFNDIKRTDGDKMVLFDSSEIRQISGRAGRYNRDGFVTCIKPKHDGEITIDSFKHVKKVLKQENPPINTIYVFPPMNIVSKLFDIFKKKYQYEMGVEFDDKYERYQRFFEYLSNDLIKKQQTTEPIFKFKVDEVINKKQLPKLKTLSEMKNLKFFDVLMLMNSPLKFQFTVESQFFTRCVEAINENKTETIFSLGLPLHILDFFVNYAIDDSKLYKEAIRSAEGLKMLSNTIRLESLEQIYRCLVLFCWLQNRYPNNFLDTKSVIKLQQRVELMIFYKLSVEPMYKLNTRIEIKNKILKKKQERDRLRQLNQDKTFSM
ncbi:hypothetical protein QEN19_000229 [Hanseniaspora menglaensis]